MMTYCSVCPPLGSLTHAVTQTCTAIFMPLSAISRRSHSVFRLSRQGDIWPKSTRNTECHAFKQHGHRQPYWRGPSRII